MPDKEQYDGGKKREKQLWKCQGQRRSWEGGAPGTREETPPQTVGENTMKKVVLLQPMKNCAGPDIHSVTSGQLYAGTHGHFLKPLEISLISRGKVWGRRMDELYNQQWTDYNVSFPISLCHSKQREIEELGLNKRSGIWEKDWGKVF